VTVLWLVAGAALIVALVTATAALLQARAAVRRQEQLTQMYWELKYQQGELRQRLQRGTALGGTDVPDQPAAPAATGTVIPLSSLKR
jgi:hypothetical protein